MAKTFDELAQRTTTRQTREFAAKRTQELLGELQTAEVGKMAGKRQQKIGRVQEKETLKGYHRRVRKGDCYEVHIRFLRNEVDEHEQRDWLVCHGTVTNAAGVAIEHCWLEHNGYAYDFSNGNSFEFSAEEFREMTKARDITAYTSVEVSVNIIKHGHYGPWT